MYEESDDNSDLIHSMRIVPVRREGSVVYARSLRLGEPDDGRRVHVAPGDQVRFEAGAVLAELEAIDSHERPTESGHKPITSVLSAWFHFGREPWDDSAVRYVLAAARRLDMANELFIRVRQLEGDINKGGLTGPQLRRKLFDVVGFVELAVISLGRALEMPTKAPDRFSVDIEVPTTILTALPAVTAFRNAYEHIEDRAFGTRHGVADPSALSIFDYRRLAEEDLIVYGEHSLNIAGQADLLIADGRLMLKALVGATVPPEDERLNDRPASAGVG
jgi:hypothetical protein